MNSLLNSFRQAIRSGRAAGGRLRLAMLAGGVVVCGLASARADLAYNPVAATDVAVTANGYAASGALTLTLGFSPPSLQVLKVVNNTGVAAISGTFTGLAEGGAVSASHGGNTFAFRLSYLGGDGNDITLTRVAGAGQTSLYTWSTVAGRTFGPGYSDGTGAVAHFNDPYGVSVDGAGNVYVADRYNHTIRKMTSAGVVTTLAGLVGNSGSADGTGSAAQFYWPEGVAVDVAGNVFVADTFNHTIRKITPAGVVTTFAGTAGSSGSANGTGSVARFNRPGGLFVDSAGVIYVADTNNHTIRKITAEGVVTTVAGLAGSSGSTNGVGANARFADPRGVAATSSGIIYVLDSSNRLLRKIIADGTVSTLAGSSTAGAADGTGTAGRFMFPYGLTVNSAGNIFVAESSAIRSVTAAGVVTTLAGSLTFGGFADGQGSAARFSNACGVAVDALGNVYVSDMSNTAIRKVTAGGLVSTVAGYPGLNQGAAVNGTGSAVRFTEPRGVSADGAGNLYVGDYYNRLVRKIAPGGVTSTLAGSSTQGSSDGTGTAARFTFPSGVATMANGTSFLADPLNHNIRAITAAGVVTTLAGSVGNPGVTDGTGSAARFREPEGVAVDASGNVYVADTMNHTIRKVTSGGVVTTIAGTAGTMGSTNGAGGLLNEPSAVAVDAAGTLYIADRGNHLIRRLTTDGVLSTVAGSAGNVGSFDGTGTNARFREPTGVALDVAGNLLVADRANSMIRKVTPAGVVTSIGGSDRLQQIEDGVGSLARFNAPRGITVDFAGRVFVADTQNDRVVQGIAASPPIATVSSANLITASSGRVNGTVNPNGFVTSVVFEYGLTESYGSTAAVTLTSVDGTSAQAVNAVLSGLASGTVYHYRLKAINVDGTTITNDRFFTTTASNNADLAALTTSAGSLTPVFSAGTVSYAAEVPHSITSATLTATVVQANATLTINGTPVVSGAASGSIGLAVGGNVITTVVTAQNGTTQKTYTVTVTRAPLNGIFATAADVPVTAEGFVASGALTLTLGFSPNPAQVLRLVNNTGATAISGTFTGLAEGAIVSASQGGNTFAFRISYTGGDGNDITLTRVAGAGQITTYAWADFAGMSGGPGNTDGPAATARFRGPVSTAVDSGGNVYVVGNDHTVRKISSGGAVTTFAGTSGSNGSANGTGGAAQFYLPKGVAVDGAGNVYVGDTFNHTIRKITPAGVVTTLAGSAGNSGSADGAGAVARFVSPQGLAVDGGGNVYVGDSGNHTIRKITPAGVVTTLAGSVGTTGSANGTGAEARFHTPGSIAVKGNGEVIVADLGNRLIRKITPAGVVTTLAGSAGASGGVDGTGTGARFANPRGVAVDTAGNVYVADGSGHTLRKVSEAGVVTTLAGTGGAFGSADGAGNAARFYDPQGVAVDAGGTLYVADNSNDAIRQVTSAGLVTTLAGRPAAFGSADGTGSAARFLTPQGVATDSGGSVYVADTNNHTIRKISPERVVTTLAGSAGSSGSANGTGSAARFNGPAAVTVDKNGNVYVADRSNQLIRKITPGGVVTTLAGTAQSQGSSDGTGSAARFYGPIGIAVDDAGNVFVTDQFNHTIRKVTAAGEVSTLAGTAGSSGNTDGTGSAARFNLPQGLEIDGNGDLYVAEPFNTKIRKVTQAGVVTTVASGTSVLGSSVSDVAVDAGGNLFVTNNNPDVRRITAGSGFVIGGAAGMAGGQGGIGAAAIFSLPVSLAMSGSGALFVVDRDNNTVVRGTQILTPFVTSSPATSVGSAAATLNGTVNPNGFVTSVVFEYGLTESYGSTAVVTLATVDGTISQGVSAVLSGLASGTTYHYRLKATNVDGTVMTSDRSFTTAASNNANLASLTLTAGALQPAFASASTSYTLQVPNTTVVTTVTATVAQGNATLTINSTPAVTGAASGSIALAVGANVITTMVTAQDGTTTKTYTVTVTRAAPAPGDVDPLNVSLAGSSITVTAVQPDGKTIIAGSFTSVLGQPRNNVARLNADGTLDTGFDPNVDVGTNGGVMSVVVQADGKVLLGGTIRSVGGITRNYIARVDSAGALDTSFNPNANSPVYAMALQADGGIVFAGEFTSVGGITRNYIARVDAAGALDTGFNPNADSPLATLAVQADGRILLGGQFTFVGGTPRYGIARLNASGTVDTGFNLGLNGMVTSMALQADGRILLGGPFTNIGGTIRNRIARVDAGGAVDAGFNPDANDRITSIAVQADGRILLAGQFTTLGGISRNRIARVNAAGQVESGFDPNADHAISSVALQADGKILIGGEFTTVGGVARPKFARLVNSSATQTLTALDTTQILWARGGSSPEVSGVTFEHSADGGTHWTPLGSATRVDGTADWELTGLGLPVSGQLRARGRTTNGRNAAGSGLVEAVISYSGLQSPEIAVEDSVGEDVPDGGSATLPSVRLMGSSEIEFTIRNVGVGTLTGLSAEVEGLNEADFQVDPLSEGEITAPDGSAALTVRFNPLAAGLRSATLIIHSNDSDEGTFEINLSAVCTEPELVLEQPAGTDVAHESTVTFDAVNLGESGLLEFTIRNTGNMDLAIEDLFIAGGGGSGDFAIESGPNAVVTGPAGSTTFKVRFTPSSAALIKSHLYIVSNDADEGDNFAIHIQGMGTVPEISVEQPAGTALPSDDLREFSPVALGASGSIEFTLRNHGNGALTGLAFNLTGANAADFSVVAAPSGPISSGGGSATFTVRFAPGAVGVRTAILQIESNDPLINPFILNFAGTGFDPAPTVAAISPATGWTLGGTSVTLTGTRFTGATAVMIGGTPVASFTVSTATSISAVTPAHAAGLVDVVVTTPYGTGTGAQLYSYVVPPAPEIEVFNGASTALADARTDNTARSFGLIGLAASSTQTFTIRNTGAADLSGLVLSATGNTDVFSFGALGAATLAPNETMTFTVTFAPTVVGVRNAVISLASNDEDENPFEIQVSGTGAIIPGTIAFGSGTIEVFENAGPAEVPIVRTVGSNGAVSVLLSTVKGTAGSPGDFTAITNQVVSFADGETSKMVPVTIIADSLITEINETFTVKITTPTGGATLGSPATATVVISEPDVTPPTVSITKPALNAKVPEGVVIATGQANDDKGLQKVEVSLNGGPFEETELVLTNPATRLFGTWTATITPVVGNNTLIARSTDLRGHVSVLVSRPFKYVNLRPLALTIDPVAGGTVTVTPALVGGNAEIGVSYTLKATAKAGYIWHEWTAPGVSGAAATSTTLTVVMTEGLAITAGFVENAFTAGSYTGLAQATGGTAPAQGNFGRFTATVTATGAVSGSINFAGTTTAFASAFDKITGDASGDNGTATVAATLSYDLNLDLTGSTEKITGTVTQIATGDVSAVDADLATFSATNKVPNQFLKPGTPTANGVYTAVFPAQAVQSGLTADQYPMGDGFGTITVTPAGAVSFTGTLADGTAVTASAPLSKSYAWPLAAIIKATATVNGVTLGGMVQFDATQADSDLGATNLQWFRTARAAAPHYPAGWPNGIYVDLVGAHYNSLITVQNTLGLATPESGELVLNHGGLTADVIKTSFKITGNTVAKLNDPTTPDLSYTLVVTPTTGAFNGTFTANWTAPVAAKPAFKGMLIQKGGSKGGYGFFLNNGTGAANQQAGGVTLGGQ